MPFDYVMTDALSLELHEKLKGSRVLKIFQPEKDKIIFNLRTVGGTEELLINVDSSNYRIQISSRKFKNPEKAPMFCMLLRKYLLSGKLVSIRQFDSDRIIEIVFIAGSELGLELKRSLIIELFGKNKNIILLDEEGKIVDSLRKTSYGGKNERAVLPGLVYKPPVKSKPDFFRSGQDELAAVIGEHESYDDGRLYDLLGASFYGLSPLLIRELISLKNKRNDLLSSCMDLRRKYEDKDYRPCLISVKGRAVDYCFTEISQYGEESENIVYPGFSALFDDFFNEKEMRDSGRALAKTLLKNLRTRLKRETAKLNLRMRELKETELMEEYRQKGELISSYIWKIKKGDDFLECENYLEAGNKTLKIDLDPFKSPSENSAFYFRKYRKAKSAANHLSVLIEFSKNKIAYLEEQISHIECADTAEEIEYLINEYRTGEQEAKGKSKSKKKLKKDRELLSLKSDDGFVILVGRSSEENEKLSFRIAAGSDIWLHAKDIPGSHVIIRCDGNKPTEETLRFAAAAAAYYSRGREDGKILVDYTAAKKVKRHPSKLPGLVTYEADGSLTVSAEKISDIGKVVKSK